MPPWSGKSGRSALVELPHDAEGLPASGERLLHLGLQEAALLLDDDQLFEPVGELAHDLGVHRVDAAHAEEAHAGPAERLVVEPHVQERLGACRRGSSRR
jgi:hypothetical protein